ncbi:PspC domain-containing protein [Nesterenkonia sphaerica]|uniref:PspC domain-containing protein n=1 Tax=Nesterenkonia sphaerica TaxID=1804988 RepID=A0A5R9A771_9MICC|nr:PspC domain-containing protein [Nesterenkonia sphaerica]TLP74360.1 PspC domain-containing protein [Nesterenkonia sphaerica]
MESFFNMIRNTGFRRGPDRLVAGIAGSVARSLSANVWLVRLLFLLSFLLPVVGLGLYLLVWVLTPWQDGSIPLERMLENQRRSQH